MNKKLGNTTLYSQNIFPDVSAMLPSSGGQNYSFVPLKKAALPKRREKYFDYTA